MRILHTSDWHLGKRFFLHEREQEFQHFLDWLIETIEKENVDVLLVSGDIFDVPVPRNLYIRMYFDFISRVVDTLCKKIIITAGNHDSVSYIESPKNIFKKYKTVVVGEISLDKEHDKEIVVVEDDEGTPALIVCAIPYIKESNLLISYGHTDEEYQKGCIEKISEYYHEVFEKASEKRKILEQGKPIPIVVMGHLFVQNSKFVEDDGMLRSEVGTLGTIPVDALPIEADYIALGHLHRAQQVGKYEHIRYSGTPLVMNFSEVKNHQVCNIIDFNSDESGSLKRTIKQIEIPTIQDIENVVGKTIDEIVTKLKELAQLNKSVWVRVIYKADKWNDMLMNKIDETTYNTKIEVMVVKQEVPNINNGEINYTQLFEEDNITPEFVFKRVLETKNYDEKEKKELYDLFEYVIANLHDNPRLN